jgi:hypothetical protein
VLGAISGADSAQGASWLPALGSAASSVAVVLLLRETAVRVGPAASLRAVLPSNREAAGLAALTLFGYLVLGVGMRRHSVPSILGGQLTIWVIYAVVVGLYVLAVRRARTLPFALVTPLEPPARRPLLTLGVMFTAAALVAGLAGGAAWLGLAVIVVGTTTGAVWFVGVAARTLARPSP